MTKQMLKTFNGWAITYHGDYKVNPFVVSYHGKTVERYADFWSALLKIEAIMPNYDKLERSYWG